MKIVSDKAARGWLKQRHILENGGRLSFEGGQQIDDLLLSPPATRNALVALAVNLVGILDSKLGWLLWLRDFSIWSDDFDEVGWKIIEAFAKLAQQPELNVNSSAMIFNPGEMLSLKACSLVPMLFMWDAYLVNGDGNTFVYFNHDDHSRISTKSISIFEEVRDSQLQPWLVKIK